MCVQKLNRALSLFLHTIYNQGYYSGDTITSLRHSERACAEFILWIYLILFPTVGKVRYSELKIIWCKTSLRRSQDILKTKAWFGTYLMVTLYLLTRNYCGMSCTVSWWSSWHTTEMKSVKREGGSSCAWLQVLLHPPARCWR